MSKIVCSDYTSSFESLVNKVFFFFNSRKNIQSLAIEIYKFMNGLPPSFLNKVFHENSSNPFEIDKNFNPEILRELDMELKTYHI